MSEMDRVRTLALGVIEGELILAEATPEECLKVAAAVYPVIQVFRNPGMPIKDVSALTSKHLRTLLAEEPEHLRTLLAE